MEYLTTPLVFGTYRLNGLILEDSLNQAMYLFGQQKRPLLVDSASKYSNISTILKLMKSSSFELGWKVDWKGKKGMNSDDETSLPPTRGQYSIYQDLKGLKNMLIENNISIKRIFRILLHNYYGKNIYLLFQQAVNDVFGQDVVPIGICNVSGDQLEALLVDKTVRIDYVQNEYHPFLETNVPQICSQYGVSFEAHSVMTNLEDYYPLLDKISSLSAADNHILEESSKQKPAQMAIAYAAAAAAMKTTSNSLSICFTTNNWVHLNEVCATRPLSLPLYNAIRKFSTYIRVVKYKGANSHSNSDWVESCDEHYIRQKVLPVLVDDIKLFEKGMVPSRLCVEIPKPHRSKGKCVDVLCRLYYGLDPSDNEALKRHTQKLGVTLTKMRKVINNVEEESRRLRGGKVASCALTAVTNPSALPMGPNDYRPAEEFNDFNNFLLYGGIKEIDAIEESKPNVRFHYGTINSDGRYDMCKQGFRNGFKESAEAVALDRPLTESMVVGNVGGDKANLRFEHGTINSDGRYDMCKQGFRNGFKASAEAVALDRPLTESMVVENGGGDKANIRFEHGTINSDGRYDMCKQGFRNGFKESAEAVALDRPLTESMVVESGGGDKANIRFEHGTINSDGRYDMCKQGFRNGFKESAEAVALDRPLTESMVVESGGGDKANIRFEHGTINSDGRYDMCKQGFRNGFKASAEAVALDRPLTESMVVESGGGDKANIRFEHGTINSDGRYDMCKQGFRNGFKESAEAVALDRPLTESMVVGNVGGDKANLRFEHGTINSDGRYDMCKQGFRNGFKESAEAVALDRPLTESMVVESGGGDKANIRFEHGTINSDGRYDMCKQGFRNGFKESAEAVALDRPLTESMVVESGGGDKANIRFEHGTINSDGRYDMCKQGFRNGFKASAEAVALDRPLTESMVVESGGGDKANIRFEHGTINSDGRYDMCKQGFRNGFKESAEAVALDRPLTESMVVESGGGDKANIRFEHGTINSDGRYDMCKQGFRNGFKASAEAVALDRPLTESMVVESGGGDKANIRFEHGTINSDGRYDMCKQGFRNGFKESAEAVALDRPLTESMVVESAGGDKANIRFEHGTINSDGRYDMCKQGFRNGFKASAEAVALDRPLTESMVVESAGGDKANIRFEHGTINSDGRYDMCKQGFRNGFKESAEAVALDRPLTESMVVESGGGDKANIRFEHGTINSDGRYDMCKQGFRNGFKASAEAVALDRPLTESMVVESAGGDKANIRFEHGTINSDGRYDMCKQGFRNGFKESAEAVALDRPLTESMVVESGGGDKANIRFEHGTINSDGRYDMCKQGFRNGFKESAEAVALDRPLTESMVVESGGGDKANIRFEHGTINSDGRYDMCKQGFRNGFKESAEAVGYDKPVIKDEVGCRRLGGRGLVKHYLIGNNRIGEDDVGSERVLALAELIKRRPDIVTWYLAGNELNAESIRYIADALATTSAKYVWFKMNPVKTGAYYLARALQRNPSIELMDLFNCGICDDGLSAFLQGLTDEYSDNRTGLKHLYLSINHITDVEVLSSVLRIVGPRLESLYLGNNPIGDEGIATLLSNLMTESGSIFKNLRRLMIGSLGLTDAALSALNAFIIATPTLVALDLGSYKSTKYFQQNSNVLTDKEQLLQLGCGILRNATLQASPRLHLLGLSNACGVGQHFVDDLLDEFESAGVNVDGHQQKNNIHVVHCGRSVYGHVGEEDIKALRDPRPAIDYIQSIYRNTMKVGGL